jgi:hypothetical protein
VSADESPERRLRRLLTELKASQELERLANRRREAAHAELLRRVAEVHESIVVPSLRAFAAELEAQGHPTRIDRRGATATHLHVQVRGRRAIEARLEVDWRHEPETLLRVRLRQQFLDLAQLEVTLDDLTEESIARLWVRALERLVALTHD